MNAAQPPQPSPRRDLQWDRHRLAQSGGAFIDPSRWPHLLTVPAVPLSGRRARAVTLTLEDLLDDRGVATDSGMPPFLDARDGRLIDRIVARGWLGLAESYMAGEWGAEPLPQVLGVLLSQPFESGWGARLALKGAEARRKQRRPEFRELPESLVELFAGATRSTSSALFASGSRTTVTEPVAFGSRRNGNRALVPVDVTWCEAPDDVERLDLDAAQGRLAEELLDLGGVGPGDRVLEMPSNGGNLAIRAARRGARVDALCASETHAEALAARVRQAGVAGAVRIEVMPRLVPSPREWAGSYAVIFSIERMETLGDAGMRAFWRGVERMLDPRGVAVVQTRITTPECRATARDSLEVMQEYLWPAMEYPTLDAIRASLAANTNLIGVREVHIGPHLAATLPLWRANFLARDRQAAAAGFDHVHRRLWDYQLALHEALVAGGDIDCVHMVVRHRPR